MAPLKDPTGLRLHAVDAEDLALVSAVLQDMLVRVGDLLFLPEERRFALAGARFDRVAEREGRLERCRAGLHFETVGGARYRHIDRNRPDMILSLLAVTFEAGPEAPSGVVQLMFAGGGAIQLDVECVEAQMRDIGPRWPVKNRPSHDFPQDSDPGA
jgi:hypothetical protein